MTRMKGAINGLKGGLKNGLLNGKGGLRARRADTFVLELASLRRERRLLGKSLKAWMHRARKMLLKRRTQEALEEKARHEQDAAS